MAYNPNLPIDVLVEIYIPPLGWVAVTSRVRKASCVISQGRSPDAIQAESSRLNAVIGNPDGYLTEGNPVSPWYPYIGRGCPIRVSRLGLSVSPAQRFYGRIDTMRARYPGGGRDSTMAITALGTLGTLGQGTDPLRSALTRAMAGVSAGDFVPIAHWPMEDGSGSTRFASSLSGGPAATITGSISPAAYAGFAGSEPLPILNQGSIGAAFPSYIDTGQWQAQFAMMVPSSGFTNDADMVAIAMVPGKPTATIYVTYIQSSGELRLSAFSAAGAILATADTVGNVWARDTPYLCAVTDVVLAGTHTVAFSIYTTGGNLLSQTTVQPDGIGAGTAGMPRLATAYASTVSTGWAYGQLALYTADILASPSIGPNARAAGGYTGESAADRMARLCREQSIGFELTGDAADTAAMGPQTADTLAANLRDCEQADQGLLHDNGTAGAIGYITLTSLYNKAAAITVTQGAVEPGLEPIWDNRYSTNDVTSTRPDGGFAHVADEEHVTATGARLKGDRRPNVATDAQLVNDAGWAVHVGTAAGARYGSVGINLRNPDGATLADAVADHQIGDRITVAASALPSQHPIDGIDGLTVGWTELLDVDTWLWRPNVVPYAPYLTGVYDDAVKRYGLRTSTIIEDLDPTETGIDVTTALFTERWITGSAAPVFPFGAGIGGEKIRVLSIASFAADDFTRSVSNGWGTATSGQTYTSTGGSASDFSVNGTKGFHTLTSTNVLRWSTLPVTGYRVAATANVSAVATGAALTARVIAGSDTANHYGVRVDFGVNGDLSLLLIKTVAGVGSALTSSIPLGTYGVGDQWRILLHVLPGVSVAGWAYPVAARPPKALNVVVADTSVSVFTAVGLGSRAETGNTNASPIVAWDDLDVIIPQRMTVTRNINGLPGGKSHTSGDPVTLWTPAVYAY